MPDNSASITRLRGSHVRSAYLSVLKGDLLLTGSISAATATAITYSVDSGAATDVAPGFRVVIETSGGAFVGETTIRYSGAISSTNLPIRETSSFVITSSHKVKVYRIPVLSDLLVEASDVFAPDGRTFSSDPAPVACSGAPYAGWLANAASGVRFEGVDSQSRDSGALTHAWSATAGTFDDDTDEGVIWTPAAAGYHLITHAVSDSQTTTQYVPAYIHDANDPPYEILISSDDMSAATGVRMTFELFEEATLADIPDNSLCVIWADEVIGGTAGSIGNKESTRSHIIATGYLRRDTSRGDDEVSTVEFELISPLARLAEVISYSKVILNNASPAAWGDVADLSTVGAFLELWMNYCNAHALFSLQLVGMVDRDFPSWYIQRATFYEQMKEILAGIDCRLICDRAGHFEVQREIQFVPLDERATPDTTLTINDSDVIDYELSREHWNAVETLRARGFNKGLGSGDNVPLFARCPATPGRGSDSPVIERWISDSAEDHLERTALHWAWNSRVFIDASGIQQHAPLLRLTLFGSYAHLWQFYREWMSISSGALVNLRGVDVSDFRWILQSVSVSYEGGTVTTNVEFQAETAAPASLAVDDTPADTALPPYEPPETPPVVSITPPGTLDRVAQNLTGFNTDGYVYQTPNYNAAVPTWTRFAPAVSGAITDAVQLPITNSRFILVSDDTDAIYTLDDVRGARTLTLRKALSATTSDTGRWRAVDAPLNSDYAVVVSYYKADATYPGVWYTYTLDAGATWATETQVTDKSLTSGGSNSGVTLFVSSRAPGEAYIAAYITTGIGTAAEARFYKLSSNFATVAQVSSPADFNPVDNIGFGIHASWASAEADMYYRQEVAATSQAMKRRNGSTITTITPSAAGVAGFGQGSNRGLHVCYVDANSVVLAGNGNDIGAKTYLSRDKGTSWTDITPTGVELTGAEFAGNDRNVIYGWGTSGAMWLYRNAAFVDKGGNISTDFVSAGTFVRIAGV
jgi:hypothetical protein